MKISNTHKINYVLISKRLSLYKYTKQKRATDIHGTSNKSVR